MLYLLSGLPSISMMPMMVSHALSRAVRFFPEEEEPDWDLPEVVDWDLPQAPDWDLPEAVDPDLPALAGVVLR